MKKYYFLSLFIGLFWFALQAQASIWTTPQLTHSSLRFGASTGYAFYPLSPLPDLGKGDTIYSISYFLVSTSTSPYIAKVTILECTNPISGCSTLGSSDDTTVVNNYPTTFYFSNDYTMRTDRYYQFGIVRVSGNCQGSLSTPCGYYGNASLPFFNYYSNFSTATSSYATTTTGFFNYQIASSTLLQMQGRCSDTSNIFSEGLCMAGSFLFVPSPDTVGQFSELKNTLANKFPFSYVNSATQTWGVLTASTTANTPVYTYKFHDWGFGSTTPMGNILPNVTAFSSTTVTQYFPAGTFDLLKGLASIALWLGLVADIFFTSRNLFHTT